MTDIKVIVSDFDGTLLDDEKHLPKQFPALLHELRQRDIHFIAASGRQYYNIRAQFPKELANQVDYIAENGALTVMNNEIYSIAEMPYEDVAAIVDTVRNLPGCYPILCGARCSYYENDFPEINRNTALYYARMKLIDDVMDYVKQDRICKIAVFNSHQAETVCYPALLPFADHMQVALSGDCWVDIMNASVNKGTALTTMLNHMNISPDQCMAFGDYLNDIELLQASGHPYAMENAHPQLRKLFKNTSGHNNHAGVIHTICRELNITL